MTASAFKFHRFSSGSENGKISDDELSSACFEALHDSAVHLSRTDASKLEAHFSSPDTRAAMAIPEDWNAWQRNEGLISGRSNFIERFFGHRSSGCKKEESPFSKDNVPFPASGAYVS